jgi:predicted nucleotidyltransferase
MGNAASVQKQFTAALDTLVARIKLDRSILAAILCGSLSHDLVWARSDIDLVLITVDDKKTGKDSLSLYAEGINVHALLLPRAEFRKNAERAIHNGFWHSFLSKGKLLYTHDETIADLLDRLHIMGERDIQIQLLAAGVNALGSIYKAHKFLVTRKDLDYTALWILASASSLAKIEVVSAGLLADREVLPQAAKLNPDFFGIIYNDLLNQKKTAKNVEAALRAVDEYMASRATRLFGALLEHLRETAEARSATEIEDHFKRNYGIEGVTGACEYLSDIGLIGKAPLPVHLTKKSNVDVEELAFFYASQPEDVY